MWASSVLRPKKHGGSFGFHAAVANGCVPVDTDGILGDTPSIDSGDPNTDRGTSVPVGTLGATLPSFGGVETLLSTSGSSCASPKCFLRAARPFPNCSSIMRHTMVCIRCSFVVPIVVLPNVGQGVFCDAAVVSERRSIVAPLVPLVFSSDITPTP